MENHIAETIAIEKVSLEANSEAIRELNDLQLSLVGGGIAELVGA
jgi:hypothetical protein